MNEIEIMQKNLKSLIEYTEMLISGEHPTDYIVGKVEQYAGVVKDNAKHVDKQVKENKKGGK